MLSKVAFMACMLGLVRAGALWNPSLESSGYTHGGYGGYDSGAASYGAGYGGHSGNAHLGSSGAVSHVSITKEISPSVPYTAGYGNSHDYAASQGLGGYGLGYNSHDASFGAGLGHGGYNHAISTASQYSIHASPAHYGSYAPSSHGSIGYPSSYNGYGYGGKSW